MSAAPRARPASEWEAGSALPRPVAPAAAAPPRWVRVAFIGTQTVFDLSLGELLTVRFHPLQDARHEDARPPHVEMLLPASTPLPLLDSGAGFSILTYNVLMPNSADGWWIYKYYGPDTPAEATTWDHRQALLREQVVGSGADIVCLQECSPQSFESDWAWLADEGYDCALLAKGRMRPATFWKRERWELCQADGSDLPVAEEAEAEAADAADRGGGSPRADKGAHGVLHGDRTLTTILRPLGPKGTAVAGQPAPLWVINAHLSAGPEARRRLRQVHEALETARKLIAKTAGGGKAAGGKAGGGGGKGGSASAAAMPARVVVAGDFNSQGHSAVRELLEAGEVLPSFRESGDPTEAAQAESEVTSKPKRQALGRFADAQAVACAASGVARPPTLIAAELMSRMQQADGRPSEALRLALDEAFARLSSDGATLSDEEQAAWLLQVNKALGRGSEHRAALAAREARGGAPLTREDFHAVYAAELAQGKFWGVEHDLRVLRGAGLREEGAAPFTAAFDYIWFATDAMQLVGVQPGLEEDELAELLSGRRYGLPDEKHASDHVPVAAAFAFVPPTAEGESSK